MIAEQPDQTIVMLDQLWRVLSYNALAGLCYALGAAPVVYAVLRLVHRGSISHPPVRRG